MEIRQKLSYLKQKRINIFFLILKTTICFSVFFALDNVAIFVDIRPFGIAMLFALLWCGYNPIALAGIFSIAYYLCENTPSSIKICLLVLLVCAFLYLIGKFKPLKYRFGLPYILCGLVLGLYIILNVADAKHNFALLISCVFALFFLYISIYFLKGTLKRGFCNRLNIDEKICGGIVLALITYGLTNISFFGVEWVLVVGSALVLVATYTFEISEAFVIGFVLGIGVALSTFNPLYVALYVSMSVFACAFRSRIKIFSTIAVVIIYLFFTLYFSDYFVFQIPTLIGILVICIGFVCIPYKVLRHLKDMFAGAKSPNSSRNVVKSSRDKIGKKLTDISKVFNEMGYTFKRTLQHSLPLHEKKELIKQDIVHKVCKDCENYNKCTRLNGDYTTKVLDSLVDAGVSKGKVREEDLDNYLHARCPKVPLLLSSANEIIKSYREYNILSYNMDCSKILVAEQFKGVGGLLDMLAKEVMDDIVFDTDLETRIMEDLLYKNIFTEEVIVYDKSTKDRDVILLVRDDKLDLKMIEKIVSKACGSKMIVLGVEPSDIPNVSIVTMSCCPNFDIVFGCATSNKAGMIVSGDTHSFIKVDNGKYMLALSDGMGSGAKARETSDLCINLIENYYRAGFDNALILSSVNKLLSLNNEETFSAIDICILDFFSNSIDFIKLGTPNSYIKRKTGVELIQSSGLPIGILEEMRPHITKKYINNFDIVILVSDGIQDAFNGKNLQVFINNLNIINPQEIADAILNKAKCLASNVCADDMTVVVARIFPTK